ncbi:hypothetical protein RUMOBE_04133 [Blautia obeum ATCC 29174]|uniref:Uncharacterized protein n=1 Tax=Blautia obeum ATCC 29174 TaxID=411459 RepID=A5ZYL6_9FIRM|nr:hypothetical protein RUMOBE_04133 [Blautia obeum ATCC 29174]
MCGEKWSDQKNPHYVLEIKIVVNMKKTESLFTDTDCSI